MAVALPIVALLNLNCPLPVVPAVVVVLNVYSKAPFLPCEPVYPKLPVYPITPCEPVYPCEPV